MSKHRLHRPLLHYRILFFAAAFYTLGILIGAECKTPAWLFMLLAGAFLCLGIFLNHGENLLSFSLAAMLCCGLMGGTMAFSPKYPPINMEERAVVIGRVKSVSEKETYCIYQLTDVEINGTTLGGNVFLTSYTMEYRQNDIILAQATLSIPEKPLHPGDFDDYRYCRTKNVLFRAAASNDAKIDHARGPRSWFAEAGQWVSDRIERLFPRHQGLAKAFIIGDESDVTDLQREQLSLIGITHILSISGSHIAVLAGLLHLFFSRMRIDRRIPFLINQVVILLYTILTGWKVSMVRAAWMYEVTLWGRFLGKKRDPLTSMSAAYLCIIASNPAQVFDLGLQLSFGAVYAMICLTGKIEEKLQFLRWETLRQTVSAGIAAALGTFPITNNLSNYYWLPNLLANGLATMYSILMIPILLLIAALYLIFGDTVRFLGHFGAWWIDVFQWFTDACTKFEKVGVYLANLLPVVMLLWYLCIFLCSDKLFWPRGYRRGIAVVMAMIVCINLCAPLLRRDPMQIRCFAATEVSAIISTEQGDRILLSGGGGEELLDCLLSEGIRPDCCILAHKGKEGLELAEQLRQMGCDAEVYADAASLRVLQNRYGRKDAQELPQNLQLSPRMQLQFLFAEQGYPQAAVLQIDGEAFCCFVFEFMEEADERIGSVPILCYHKGMNSRLPQEMAHEILLIAENKEFQWSSEVVNLYRSGQTVFFPKENGTYRMESKYASFGIYE